MPGIPAVVVGMNADAAWGMSSAMPDDADIYREELHPTDPTLYAFRGEWRRLAVREEEILVRGKGSRRVSIRYIPHGKADCPLLSDLVPMADPLSLRWTGLEPSREMDALLKINQARTLEAFREALRDFALPAQNFIYADREGNIAYFCAGRFPRRKKGEGPFPLDGVKGASEWEGDIPFEELPFEINPPSGLIVTANHRVIGDAYPHELTYLWEPPHRARRILELLERERLEVSDMAAAQMDILSLQAKELVEGVIGPAFPELQGRARQAAERLLRWDFRMGVESQEAALYHAFYDQIRRQLFAEKMNRIKPYLYEGYFSLLHLPVSPVDQILLAADPTWFPDGRGEVVARALEGAVRFLREGLGPEEAWTWGSLHRLTLRHPLGGSKDLGGRILNRLFRLNHGPFSHPGDGMTVNVAAYLLSRPFESLVGPVYRQIVDLASPENSQWVVPGGSSGDPLSPHYNDQLEDWRWGRYHPMFPCPDALQAVLELFPSPR
jgi:penicillin amidase